MSFETLLRGRIAEGPVEVEVAAGDPAATSFVISDAQNGEYAGQQVAIDALRCCEVVCRGDAATRALAALKKGDAVVVWGELVLSGPLDVYNDQDLVLVHLQARAVGVDLAAPRI